MTWDLAQQWIAAMNTASYRGYSDWRLTRITDTGAPGCDGALHGTDCGYNVDLSTGELAHLWYGLGNIAYCDTSGICPQIGWGLMQTAPFNNFQDNWYWSGTEYAPDPSYAWHFHAYYGYQYYDFKDVQLHVWAVRPGDVAPAPAARSIPTVSAWGLGMLGLLLTLVARRRLR